MKIKIAADSCCDIYPEMREKEGVVTVPLTMLLAGKEYTDDDNLNLTEFISEMKNCKGKIGSSAPSPMSYAEAFKDSAVKFVVTLSSKLSASYSSAISGREIAGKNDDLYIFDTKSASAGEALTVLKIREFIEQGLENTAIIEKTEKFIKNMKTYFVLDNVDNLQKNGRLNILAAKIINVLHIRPIMGSDGDGNIALFSKARGNNQVVEKFLDLIKKSGKNTEGEKMVISHCNNLSLAEYLKTEIKSRFPFEDITILPTRGLSSMYANEKGVIMAF